MKKFSVVVSLGMVLFAGSACAKKLPENTLVIGMECGYPPFNWAETTASEFNVKVEGKNFYCDGYDIQIAKRIASEMGYDLQIKQYAWEGLIPALQSQQINAIIAGMSNTEERAKQVAFSTNYYISDLVAVVRQSDYATVDTLSIHDFTNKTVISQMGTVTNTVIEQMNGAIHGTPTETFPLAATAVSTRVADALICEYPVALDMVQNDSSLKIIHFSDGFVVEDENQLGVAVAVNKKETDLLEKINEALLKISHEEQQQIMEEVILRRNGE